MNRYLPRHFFVAITVTSPSLLLQQDLVKELQTAFDQGVEGQFQTLRLPDGSYLILFQRDAGGEDRHMLTKRILCGQTESAAAIGQLVDELAECMPGGPIKSLVLKGERKVMDFDGVLDALAEDVFNQLPSKPDIRQFWRTTEGTLVQIVDKAPGVHGHLMVRSAASEYLVNEHGAPLSLDHAALRYALGLHLCESGFMDELCDPVFSAASAEAFLHSLHAQGKLFHPEDDPATLVNGGKAVFSPMEAEVLRIRMAEVRRCLGDNLMSVSLGVFAHEIES